MINTNGVDVIQVEVSIEPVIISLHLERYELINNSISFITLITF
jgi:hypothetical protein